MKPEACAVIFGTASPVFKFIKSRNKKIKNVSVAAHVAPLFLYSYKDVLQNPKSAG